MATEKIVEELKQRMEDADFRCAFVSTRHLPELKQSFEQLLRDEQLDKKFYGQIVERLDLRWHFEPPANVGAARSVIITAVPQPKASLSFDLDGKKHYAIVPPTYSHYTDKTIIDISSPLLAGYGYAIHDALLPSKLLAVRSGLARYGKNNITYIDGWGSYFRLRVFFSDIPCTDENWQEPEALELCGKCTACIRKCPTQAIRKDRFLLEGGRCLTFYNEGQEEFPEWIDPESHNCLVGCMVCQDVCPANKEHVAWVMPGGDFSEEETMIILEGVPRDEIPADTAQKLERVGMLEYYELLKRNLGALINNPRKHIAEAD